jgi:hypothetical protein
LGSEGENWASEHMDEDVGADPFLRSQRLEVGHESEVAFLAQSILERLPEAEQRNKLGDWDGVDVSVDDV